MGVRCNPGVRCMASTTSSKPARRGMAKSTTARTSSSSRLLMVVILGLAILIRRVLIRLAILIELVLLLALPLVLALLLVLGDRHAGDAEVPFDGSEPVDVDHTDEVDDGQLPRLGGKDEQAVRRVAVAHVEIDLRVLAVAALHFHHP